MTVVHPIGRRWVNLPKKGQESSTQTGSVNDTGRLVFTNTKERRVRGVIRGKPRVPCKILTGTVF